MPIDKTLALQNFIVPLEQFDIIFNRMITIPFDIFEILNARLLHWTPKLDRPRIHTAMLIRPFIERASDHFLGIIFELVEYRNIWIARDLGALRTNLLGCPHIFRVLIIRPIAETTR